MKDSPQVLEGRVSGALMRPSALERGKDALPLKKGKEENGWNTLVYCNGEGSEERKKGAGDGGYGEKVGHGFCEDL